MDQLAEVHLLLHMLMVTQTQAANKRTVADPTLTRIGHTPHQMMWDTTTSAIVMNGRSWERRDEDDDLWDGGRM